MIKRIVLELLKYILTIVILILTLFPLYYLIVVSLTSTEFLSRGVVSFVPDSINNNYQTIIGPELNSALALTASVLVSLIVIRLVVYTLAGFGLNKVGKITRKIVFGLFLFVSIVPEITIYIALRVLLFQINATTTSLIFSLASNSIFSFFIMIYVYKSIQSVSASKSRIMKIDKLRWYQQFVYVYLPVLKMPFFLLVVFTAIQSWNDYLWPNFLLSGTALENITIWFLRQGSGAEGGTSGLASLQNLQAAGSFISLIIPLGIYLIFSYWINRGISRNV
ncbi:ABC transporter permease subunit [[Mycoplasma] testudinis]|uniref:ABC transporter permease subunit n=1 Tax=[Mycoplasma] testudinis TaxID=33924 RepID=UPI00056326CC|nr:ABC transporter permease subunit [[Mycoplasma] testudinis]